VIYPENVVALYDLDRLHSFDTAWDTLARIGVASGHVYPLLTEMIEREAQGGEHIFWLLMMADEQRIVLSSEATRLSRNY